MESLTYIDLRVNDLTGTVSDDDWCRNTGDTTVVQEEPDLKVDCHIECDWYTTRLVCNWWTYYDDWEDAHGDNCMW